MANASFKNASNLLNYVPKRHVSNLKLTSRTKSDSKLLLQKEALKVSKLQNGIVVATLENHNPISRLAVVINASTRHETYDLQGASHALRSMSNLSTKGHTSYGLTRTLDHIGASFCVSSTREHTFYNLITTRDNLMKASNVLSEVVCSPLFNSWEIETSLERLKLELDLYKNSPEIRINDLLHKSAFINGLSQPIFASSSFINNINEETLKEYRSRNYSLDKLALVGIGMKHEFLVRYAERFRLQPTSSRTEPSKYLGTEIREDLPSDIVHVAVATEGASKLSKEFLASGIVHHAFGVGSRIKWSDGSSRIARACLPLASEPATISSFNLNYSDAGLFGFNLIAHRNDVGKITKGIFKECANIAKNGFTSTEIDTAKNNFKSELSMSLEYPHNLIESIGSSTENSNVSEMSELFKAIDNVSSSDINSFAKKLNSNKASLVAIGDLRNLPRLADLYI